MEKQRLSRKEKEAENFKWYKEKVDNLLPNGYGSFDSFKVMDNLKYKVIYDLFNGKLDEDEYKAVCMPYGEAVGKLPTKIKNFDILSRKIKALLGIEMKRKFMWKAVAINPEATTRREEEEFGKIKEWVYKEAMDPLLKELEIKYAQELKGKELSEEEKNAIQQRMDEEREAMTPDKIKKYMMRDYQDPAEEMVNDLLEYLINIIDLHYKFSQGFKHASLSAKEIYYVGAHRGNPNVWVVNPLHVTLLDSGASEFIEDSEEIAVEYYMTKTQIISLFGDELTEEQIDKIFDDGKKDAYAMIQDESFFFNSDTTRNTRPIIHRVWKDLRKIGFLTYKDMEGKIQEKPVDEEYEFNEDLGDLLIEWEWIPETYEGWKLADDIYVRMRPVEGQLKDLNSMYNCKLPYYGAIYDNVNSEPVSMGERLLMYQFYYNVIMYRIENLLAGDKGKKILMNINMIPDSAGIDIKKWQYFAETTPYMWYDPNEEGSSYQDVNTVAKVLDLGLISNVNQYIEAAEYIRMQAGATIGVTDQVEGQITPNEAVTNTRQNLVQSSYILEPYFFLHNKVKRNVLQAIVELAKVVYSRNNLDKLTFVVDDFSKKMLEVDLGLLDNNTFGIFINESVKTEEIKQQINQMSFAAMQNGGKLSDIISLIRKDSIIEAEESIRLAEDKAEKAMVENEKRKEDSALRVMEKQKELDKEKHERDKELIVLKEQERRKTVVAQSYITGASFNVDADKDDDGVNDFIELAQNELDKDERREKMDLDREKFEHQKKIDKEKIDIDKKKLLQPKSK